MAIVKAKQREYHARIPNETARDKNLSLKAKGLLCVLLSMDEDWKIYKTQIAEYSKDKRDGTFAAFDELIKKGYIIDKGRVRNEKGYLAENIYEVHAEKPLLNKIKPIPENPTLENPTLENPVLSNYTSTYSTSIDKIQEKQNQEVNLNINTEADAPVEIQAELFQGKEAEPLEEKKPMTLRQLVIDFWLKEFHKDWKFTAVDGKKIDLLIKHLQRSLGTTKKEYSEDDVLNLFKVFCTKLPAFYKNKNLSILESHYDTIIEEIKNGKSNTDKQPGKRAGVTNFKFDVPDPRKQPGWNTNPNL